MKNKNLKSQVHLVGSIPLSSAEEVFKLIGKKLSGCCHRIPDGETGDRSNWRGWQSQVFANQEALIRKKNKERAYQLQPPYTFATGYGKKDLDFSDLGFAREAILSFSKFNELQQKGVLPESAKFMVALPTPFAPVYSFISYGDQAAVLPIYEAAILSELDQIIKFVPHEKLSIQWDVATEMSIFEGVYKIKIEKYWDFLINLLVRLGDKTPSNVELGYHLCYGSMNNKHWKEPENLSLCVRVSNILVEKLSRACNFVHMPVPEDRSDEAYFCPLTDLNMNSDTEVFLGLIHDHQTDKENIKKIKTAQKFLLDFGIATECGLGRREKESIPNLFELHNKLSEHINELR